MSSTGSCSIRNTVPLVGQMRKQRLTGIGSRGIQDAGQREAIRTAGTPGEGCSCYLHRYLSPVVRDIRSAKKRYQRFVCSSGRLDHENEGLDIIVIAT